MKLKFMIVFAMGLLFNSAVYAQVINNTIVAKGYFQGADSSHKAQGEVALIKQNHHLYLVLEDTFKVTKGPDLFIMLTNSKNNSVGMFTVTQLKTYSGAQMYKVDLKDKDLLKYDRAIIYCKEFSVLFGFAPLTFNSNAFLYRRY